MDEKKGFAFWSGRFDPALVVVIIAALLIYGGERSANAETRETVKEHDVSIQKVNETLAKIEAQLAFLVKEAQK